MVPSECADRLKFKTKDGTRLTSIHSHPCADNTTRRYVLWSDILHTFHGIDHLETADGKRVLFMIDSDERLWQPLRIQHSPHETHIVVYGSNRRQQASDFFSIPQDNNDHGPVDSLNLVLDEIRPPLKDLFDTCKYLYRHLETVRIPNVKVFREAVVNTRYHHLTLEEEIKRLDRVGVKTLIDGKDKRQLLEELRCLQEKAADLEYQSTSYSTVFQRYNHYDYATSSLFIVLPVDLDTWDDSDLSTHKLRIYYLCDNLLEVGAKENMPQHVHLCNHPGYNIKRQQEFLLTYGDHLLRTLLMIKRGFSYSGCEIPPLDTFKILWNCDPNIIGSYLTKDTIGPLMNKAIAYLQELSPPKWTGMLGLSRNQSKTIRTFFEVQHGDHGVGNLHRYITEGQYVYWRCQAHAHQKLNDDSLEGLKTFVCSHGGFVDMRQAKLGIELGSSNEAEEFRKLLKSCGHGFDISIKLRWEATHSCMKDLCLDISSTGTVVLEIDGIKSDRLDVTPLGYRTRHLFINERTRIGYVPFITLLNYPAPGEQCIFLERFSLQSKYPYSPLRSLHEWVELASDLIRFYNLVYKAQDSLDWNKIAKLLQSTLEKNGLALTNVVTMYGGGQTAVFDQNNGALVEVHTLYTTCNEGVLTSGTIKILQVFARSLQFDKGFFRAVQTNSSLQELNVFYLGHNMLTYIGHIVKVWLTSARSIRITMLDHSLDKQDRVVAQVAIRGSHIHAQRNGISDVEGYNAGSQISLKRATDLLLDIEFLQWDCDHVFSQLSDYSAWFLNMATRRHPTILSLCTLDVSCLSQVGLSSIQEVFNRSSLEHLHIVCTPVDSLSKSISQVLGSIQWNTLKSLNLSGDNIDAWCQIWPLPLSPRLLSLKIQGSSPTGHHLSHSSVLFVRQLIYSSPLMELSFRNLQLRDKRDWELLIDSMDLPSLQNLDLGEHGAMQFLAGPDALTSMFRVI